MDWFHSLIVETITKLACDTLINIGTYLVDQLTKAFAGQKVSKVQVLLEQIGTVSPKIIRNIVKKAAEGKNISENQQEELIQLLSNLATNARFHTTNGTKISRLVRCEELIATLLDNIQPSRRKGETASEGNDWILQEFLGRGSFGEVWRSQNPHFHEPRVFKFFTEVTAQEWLLKEGSALSTLNKELGKHPNIIEYLDIQLHAKPYPYLAFGYADIGSLENWILESPSQRIDLNIELLIKGIIEGLREAHEAEIYHRDLKPANILLKTYKNEDYPIPLIADFGLSRTDNVLNISGRSSSFGSRDAIVGTAMYLPPEAGQYRKIDPAQQDIFAVGVTWYQLLVHKLERPPYDFAEELRQHGVDSRTIRLVSSCLANPNRRFRNAIELDEAFQDLLPSPIWDIPEGCFDVGPLAVAYFETEIC